MTSFEATRDDVSVSSDFSGEIGAHRDSDSSSELDLESGVSLVKLHLNDKPEKDCRICQLGLESNSQEFQPLIELGCFCKGDLGAAHRKCAETWFKIKGNMTCEICGSTAVNVTGEQTNQSNSVSAAASSASPGASFIIPADQRFWNPRRAMNLLFASMIFAFFISWLFHFKVLS
ncbi:hypothetical protein ACOSP7_025014 [Xanthoceras sorbifolium]|uniref:RING-CH-type domain-containing protein n=1 Tax=Xanthoceras sorbifolium TaxID=99658 RepID=A0ABQ8H7U2_9ROSI|nr:hypothetical protein JRO89_XS13G0111000 [Xanthoceras sorbifolium]